MGGLCLLAIGMGAIWLDPTVCGDLAGYAQKRSALLRGFLVVLTYELLYEAYELAVVYMVVVRDIAAYPCLAWPLWRDVSLSPQSALGTALLRQV